MQPHWVIVETRSSAEELVERGLRAAGYRVYLPRYRKLLKPHGRDRRFVTAMRPLFSRLLFAQDWHGWPQHSISGSIGLLRTGRAGNPARLSDDDVATIQRKERECLFDDVRYPPGSKSHVLREDLTIGDEVRFELSGTVILGVLDELSDDGKAVVRAIVFGRETAIRDVDADTLDAVGS